MDKRYTELNIEELEGKQVFVATDETVDREGDIISLDGWDLSNFKRNPILLWSHNPFEPMIGRAKNIRMRNVGGSRKLTFEPEFHEKSPLSKLIADLVKEGWIKTVSVGFRAFQKEGNRFTKQELMEISFVNIPANPEATQLAFSKGYSKDTVGKLFNIVTEVEAEPNVGGAIGYKQTPLAVRAVEWNGPEQMAVADIDDLKAISAWFDESKPEVKSSYKLAHHEAHGEYKVNFKGVVSAMGKLLGVGGELDIPEEDRKGVYNHLAKHYAEFNEEPPKYRVYSEAELKTIFPELYPVTLSEVKQLNNEIKSLGKALEYASRPASEPRSSSVKGRQLNEAKVKSFHLIKAANKALDSALYEMKKGI